MTAVIKTLKRKVFDESGETYTEESVYPTTVSSAVFVDDEGSENIGLTTYIDQKVDEISDEKEAKRQSTFTANEKTRQDTFEAAEKTRQEQYEADAEIVQQYNTRLTTAEGTIEEQGESITDLALKVSDTILKVGSDITEFDSYPKSELILDSENKFVKGIGNSLYIDISGIKALRVTASQEHICVFWITNGIPTIESGTEILAEGETGRRILEAGVSVNITIGSDAKYLFLYEKNSDGDSRLPESIACNANIIGKVDKTDFDKYVDDTDESIASLNKKISLKKLVYIGSSSTKMSEEGLWYNTSTNKFRYLSNGESTDANLEDNSIIEYYGHLFAVISNAFYPIGKEIAIAANSEGLSTGDVFFNTTINIFRLVGDSDNATVYFNEGDILQSNGTLYVCSNGVINPYYNYLPEISTKKIPLTYNVISYNNGEISSTPLYDKCYCDTNFIKVPKDKKIKISSDTSCYLHIIGYDADFEFVSSIPNIEISSTEIEQSLDDYDFIRVDVIKDTSHSTSFNPSLHIKGAFEDEWRFKAKLQNGETNFALTCIINAADPSSDIAETSTVQDEKNLLADFGVLALPSSYSNVGAPTRLIIFCHGSAIHYEQGQKEFNTAAYGMNPAYWLSEGYAVMDIEGNPFDNTGVHKFIPQAYQCYLAAYKSVVNTFNICTDGVFIGGRSLGGAMCFEIVSRDDIPVIAACPFVPAPTNAVAFFGHYNANERAFSASHMGMTGEVTWTSNNPITDNELQYISDNFRKFSQSAPSWKLICDLPSKATLLSVGQEADSAAESELEWNVYSGLHMRSKVPVKMFGAYDDASVPHKRGIDLYYEMLTNGGTTCERRMFLTGGHPFDLASQNAVATYVNSKGVELENVPIAYIEALQFWKRYEY